MSLTGALTREPLSPGIWGDEGITAAGVSHPQSFGFWLATTQPADTAAARSSTTGDLETWFASSTPLDWFFAS